MRRPTFRVRRNGFFSTAAQLCRKYLQWYGNASLRQERNGERWLLTRLADARLRTVVDVGANIGKWATNAAAALPEATIFALEIVPATFQTLRVNTAGQPRIFPVNLGLADYSGQMRIRYNPEAAAHSTFTDYPHPWDHEEVLACPVTTGDEFLRARGLDAVDVLKIDVEGAEHLVLKGLSDAFAGRRIRFVQFEYGRFNVLTGFRLKDFHDFFKRHGYVVGKLFPDYVELRPFRVDDEDFFIGGNYVACRVEEPLRQALARG